MRQGNTLSYLLSDGLGSTTIALSSTGSVTAVQLFAPYGSWRYSKGSMPTDYTFTGQRLDRETGLLYYGARYYDPLSGRFTQADLLQNNVVGMDPYAYVGNNPETRTDPTGEMYAPPAGPGSPPQGNPPTPPTQNPPPTLTSGESGLTQLRNELLGARYLYAYARLIIDAGLGNSVNSIRDLLTLVSVLHIPTFPNTKVISAFTGLIDQNQGDAYELIRLFIGDKALSRLLRGVAIVFDVISIIYFVVDAIQNGNNSKTLVADAVSTAAYVLDLLRKPLSEKLAIDSTTIDSIILVLGGIGFLLQLSNDVQPPSNQGNNDKRDRRRGFGGGGFPPPPPLPPFLPATAMQPHPAPQGFPEPSTTYPGGIGLNLWSEYSA
jgi:RHS repeat-associated protein